VHKFSKIQEPPQNSRCQKGDMKQVPYWGSTDIRHPHKKWVTIVNCCMGFVQLCIWMDFSQVWNKAKSNVNMMHWAISSGHIFHTKSVLPFQLHCCFSKLVWNLVHWPHYSKSTQLCYDLKLVHASSACTASYVFLQWDIMHSVVQCENLSFMTHKLRNHTGSRKQNWTP
jgi:hypothetical protein